MFTPEDFTPERLRIHWYAILLIFVVQLIVLIALSIVVANHSMSSSSAASRVAQVDLR
ncbi:MAG: hypothetical protein WA820_15445 [Bradyrhizobium sp.]|jgi:hypothetical protein